MTAKYVIGIDLGTTNSVVAFAELGDEAAEVELLQIPQLVDEHTLEERSSLASFGFLSMGEPTGALDTPWAEDRDFCIGEYARRKAAENADRTISAAKSWLSHSGVDRRAPILPWQTPANVEKLSPVAASQLFLEHLVAAWNAAQPDHPLNQQQVVLTVPASFDAVARELTREAAIAAGLPDYLVLLEESQAAVYAWLAQSGDTWRDSLSVGDQLLVCDIGGGTTDLTLIAVDEVEGELLLRRQAVGNHLLVGGDNMDLTLAHQVSEQFAERGTKLDPWQSVSLWHSCRAAKETLLTPDGPEKHTISVLGRGSKLIGGTVSVEVDRASVGQLMVDGFLPDCNLNDSPVRQRASGFQQLGLPFEADTGVTRHVAAFLSSQVDGEVPQPTHVLFNGGVFKAEVLQQRFVEVLNSWFAGGETNPLPGTRDLDHAVAIGAAHYGRVKQQGGIRIRGGVAHAYYVGIETAGLAIPGAPRPLNALCVVPIGMEEGTEVDVPSGEIGLVHGEQAQFRFFSSAIRKEDQPGAVLQQWHESELAETTALTATLESDEAITEPYVPVRFQSRITELGMFELWCIAVQGEGSWKLEFNVRDGVDES